MAKSVQAWIPKQHGAWAMLIVPFVAALVLRARAVGLDGWLAPMGLAIFTGYFGFNALTLWLRAAKTRRAPYRRPIQVYGAVTALLAILVLVLGGWPLLGWLPIATPLAGLAIWLAAQRKDRAVASGFATVALAVGAGLAARFASPLELLTDWSVNSADLLVFVALFGYFFGTVWHVKALIRERGQRPARRRALIWHLALVALATLAALTQAASPAWIVFFALTVARTWWLTRPQVAATLKPLQIGIAEIVLSVLALLIAVL